MSLSNLTEPAYLKRLFVEPPRGFEPRTYALRVGYVWKPLAVRGTSCTRFNPCLGGVLRASVVHPPDEVVDHFFGPLHVGGESQA